MRPEAHRAPGEPAPEAFAADRGTRERPRVLLTFGTLYGAPGVLSPLIGDIASLPVDLHVTLGLSSTPEDFDVDRERVTFEPFRPISELLSEVDVVVGHGGAGTTYAALSAGIPLVLLPQGADQFSVADRAVSAGAAVRLLPGETTPDGIRRSITSVLTDPRHHEAAARVAKEIADMPTAVVTAEVIAMVAG